MVDEFRMSVTRGEIFFIGGGKALDFDVEKLPCQTEICHLVRSYEQCFYSLDQARILACDK